MVFDCFEYTNNGTYCTITGYDGDDTDVTIPDIIDGLPVMTIRKSAFEDCLCESITIPNSVTSIEDCAFMFCCDLEDITIPDSVTIIGESAFSDCFRLTSITIPNSVTSIGKSAFEYCSSLTEITVGENNENYTSADGVLFNKDKTTLICYPRGKTGTSYTIPGSVTSIGDYAFLKCSILTNIVIPDSVTIIGNRVFNGCSSLASISLPDSVTSIGSSAFFGCSELTSITIPNSVTSIGKSAFDGCSSLTSITIPNSVTHIGYNIFKKCENLENIYYDGSSSDWDEIKIANENFALGKSRIVFKGGIDEQTYTVTYHADGARNIFDQEKKPDIALTLSLTVPTKSGYTFKGWSTFNGGSVAYVAGASYTANANVDLYAVWEINTYTVTYHADGASNIPANQTKTHDKTLTLSPTVPTKTDYTFIGWSTTNGGSVAYAAGASYTANANVDLYAVWETNTYTITYHADGASNIPANQTKTHGKTLTLSSTVPTKSGYTFKGWATTNGGSVAYAAGASYTANANVDLYAVWEINSVLDFKYENHGTYVVITKYIGKDTDVSIPKAIDDLPVTGIGEYAFYNCSNLTSITIPDSVTSIGDSAFYNCSSLTSITIPDSVTSIGDSAFYDCSSLTSITIPDSVTSIGDSAFYNCSSLTSITIPDSVTSIGGSAFCDCSSLTSITIPDSVTSIGDYAFGFCSSLTSITIPDSVTSIGDYAFNGCSSLTSITIPDSVTSIGDYAFNGCSSLTGITVAENNENYASVDGVLFNKDKTTLICYPRGKTGTSYTIPGSVTSIGEYAFYNCSNLTSITLPNSVTNIGDHAFYDCSSLTSITIPDSVTSIGEYAFYNCSSLTSITIPDSVTSIGDYAFHYCSSLTGITVAENNENYTSVDGVLFNKDKTTLICYPGGKTGTSYTIPGSVTSIGDSAFYYCSSLTSITIPDSVTSIGDSAFFGCRGLTSITIPDSVTSIGNSAFGFCSSLTSITLPNSVTNIGDHAFHYCSSLTSITIPDSVTSIGDSAFELCWSLTSITIPDSVTSIGWSAFRDCWSLTSITIPDSVTSIGWSAFRDCSSLTTVYYSGSSSDWAKINIDSDNSALTNANIIFNSGSAVQTYTVTYHADGASNIPANQTKTHGKTLTLSSTVPTKSGYTFKGWATTNGGSVAYAAGASYTANANVDLYAVWETNTYTITYHADGASNIPANQTKTHGKSLTLSSTVPTKSGYTFKGWATTNGGSVAYVAGASYTANANVDLYAVWETNTVAKPDKNVPTIKVSSESCRAGDEVTVSVSVVDNKGIAGFAFNLNFDNTKLVPVSIEDGPILKNSIVSNIQEPGADVSKFTYVRAVYSNYTDFTRDGVIFTVKFRVKENVEECDIPLNITYTVGNICNAKHESISPNLEGGFIKVENVIYGDADGDGVISVRDTVLISQYLAEWVVDFDMKAADVFYDEKVDIRDSVTLSQYLAEWKVTLGKK